MAAFHGISTQDVNDDQIVEEDDKTNLLTLLMFEFFLHRIAFLCICIPCICDLSSSLGLVTLVAPWV